LDVSMTLEYLFSRRCIERAGAAARSLTTAPSDQRVQTTARTITRNPLDCRKSRAPRRDLESALDAVVPAIFPPHNTNEIDQAHGYSRADFAPHTTWIGPRHA